MKKKQWSLVVPTSMGVRLTPATPGQPFHTSRSLLMQATSAETNVATVAASLGLPVKALTTFVKDSPVAQFIKADLRSRGIAYEGPEESQDGPWGARHQINMADSGFGARGPRVWNDRSGEIGCTLDVRNFDLDRLFGHEGVEMLHLSGLIAALSDQTSTFCIELARAAKEHGTRVAFDLNYRASFWEGCERTLFDVFNRIASMADILIGNEEDFQLCLGIDGPEAGGKNVGAQTERFKEMIRNAKRTFSGTSVFATTLREVLDANHHLWGAIMLAGDEWHCVEPRPIRVLDRIGGGDGFVGGLLYGILRGWEPQQWIRFGWATGTLAVTSLTDYAQPTDEAQVWSIWEGNARVMR
ncbi:PfkB family carbohydrate kinase [Tannerella sp.]|uniref:PfkB family carbohydrate kinase n=1 Tax=Tannerella sp. TaxID=2382127 RepID=UPI0026DB312D|nr:PfkB family carbohydrate kinase [Tannerella sp.]MDO4703301.1 PfkB family carbohydrate kinase [Tannerella sp.]